MATVNDKSERVLPDLNSPVKEKLYTHLSRRFRAPLMSFFRRRTGDSVEAEEMAQEVLVRVLESKEQKRLKTPDAFIFKIARNMLHDRARHADVCKRNLTELEMRYEDTKDFSPERVTQGKQELMQAMAALAELSEKTRDIFILSRLEGMKYREIATLYGISVSAVEKHLIKAFAHMMEKCRNND